MFEIIRAVSFALWHWLLEWPQRHPEVSIPLLLALIRSFGTTVETGSTGVLYVWGRARKTLEPGSTERITFNSTSARAADFQMDLRYSR